MIDWKSRLVVYHAVARQPLRLQNRDRGVLGSATMGPRRVENRCEYCGYCLVGENRGVGGGPRLWLVGR